MNIKVFISHSTADKPFVRKLDSALVSNGIDVFLDEREIKVGDSIPESIYSALENTTHLIYVISVNSIRSKWVSEELSIAKMQEKSGAGIKVLPCLIDNAELPISVKHIKYCNFKDWHLFESFSDSVKEILDAIGVQLKIPETAESVFYIKHIVKFNEVEDLLGSLSTALYSAPYAAQAIGKGNTRDDANSVGKFASKMLIYPAGVESIEFLISEIFKIDFDRGSMLSILADKLNEFMPNLSYPKQFPNEEYRIQKDDVEASTKILSEIHGMLKNIRLKVTEPILSSYLVNANS